jgi:hypothetical protein
VKVELRPGAPRAHDRVSRGIAVGNLGERKVGDDEQAGIQRGLDVTDLKVELLHLFARALELLQQIVGGLLRFLSPGDFLACRIAGSLERLDLGQELAAALVEPLQLIQHRVERPIQAPSERRASRVGVLAKQPDVNHGN